MKVDYDLYKDHLAKTLKPQMAFDSSVDFDTYKKQLRAKFEELLCINRIKDNACVPTIDIESVEDKGTYTITRFTVETEKFNYVPCYLLVPNTGKETYPLIITIQGHTPGMYISIGEMRDPSEIRYENSRFGLQAVENGYAALAIEMRGRGEQTPKRENRRWDNAAQCRYGAYTDFIMGRVIEGERVWDISRIIDVMPQFKNLDLSNLIITGNSGGGTLAYYAGCYDERIKLVAPTCSFCPYPESILTVYHCVCNYIPHAYEWFDMQDLSALIPPRRLLIMTGIKDRIFPIYGVERGYQTAKQIFTKAGVPQNLDMLVMPKDHYWCENLTWPTINSIYKKMK